MLVEADYKFWRQFFWNVPLLKEKFEKERLNLSGEPGALTKDKLDSIETMSDYEISKLLDSDPSPSEKLDNEDNFYRNFEYTSQDIWNGRDIADSVWNFMP